MCTWFFDKNGGIYHGEVSRNFLLFFLLIWTLALQYLFMRWRENFSKLFCHHYLVSMLQVQNDTTIHCCVKLLEGRNRRKATEFTDLFVSWQPMITTSVNDVSKSIFVKIYIKNVYFLNKNQFSSLLLKSIFYKKIRKNLVEAKKFARITSSFCPVSVG